MSDLAHLPLVRTGERLSFKRCRWQWHKLYVLRLQPKSRGTALRFGTLVHTALERYYVPGRKRGPHPVKTFLEEYDKEVERLEYEFGQRDEDGEWHDARELGEDMLTRYVEHWREDDKLWEVVSPEIACVAVVTDKRGKPMARYLLQLDVVIFHHGYGRHLFVDHKTAKSMPDPEEKELDEQCGSYWLFGPDYLRENSIVPKKATISGFLYNYLRKSVGDDRPQNDRGQYLNKPAKEALLARAKTMKLKLPKAPKVEDLRVAIEKAGENPDLLGAVSKSQPPPYFKRFTVYKDEAEKENVLYRVRAELYEMSMVRKGKLGLYKSPMFGGMNACPGCPVYGACTIHESGGDWEEVLRMTMDEGDPYEQYREELELEGL